MGFILSKIESVKSSLFSLPHRCNNCSNAQLPTFQGTPSVSFAGSFFLYPYHVGVADFIYDHFDTSECKVIGVSGGCYVALSFLLERPSEWMRRDWPKCVDYINSRKMKIFCNPNHNKFFHELWTNYLPENAAQIVNNRLTVITSKLKCCRCVKNEINQFDNNEELVQSLLQSGNIPCVVNIGKDCFAPCDGGFTCNSPMIDSHTISVTPYPSNAEICPGKLLDYDPTKAHHLKTCLKIAECGYRDAKKYGVEKFLKRGWKLKKPSYVLL